MGVRWSVNSALDFGMKRDDCYLGLLHCVMTFYLKPCSTLAVFTHTVAKMIYPSNRPFPGCLKPLFESEAPCKNDLYLQVNGN